MRHISVTAAENEFIAEETMIKITSRIDHDEFYFLSGTYGPLSAGLPCDLPLWLALTLRRKGKCTIQPPEWMSVVELERVVAREKSEDNFEALPFHYVEISQLLINYAKEDIPDVDKVSTLLQDIENIRMDRARIGLKELSEQVSNGQKVHMAALRNISAAEILSIGGFMVESFDMFRRLTTAEKVERSKFHSRKYATTTVAASSTVPGGEDGAGEATTTTALPGGRGLRKFRKI